MPKLRANIGVSLKKRGGQTYGIDLIRQPMRRPYWGHRDESYSADVPEATATYIAEHVRRWLPTVDVAMGHDAISQILRLTTRARSVLIALGILLSRQGSLGLVGELVEAGAPISVAIDCGEGALDPATPHQRRVSPLVFAKRQAIVIIRV